jgi:hypothetical protein
MIREICEQDCSRSQFRSADMLAWEENRRRRRRKNKRNLHLLARWLVGQKSRTPFQEYTFCSSSSISDMAIETL